MVRAASAVALCHLLVGTGAALPQENRVRPQAEKGSEQKTEKAGIADLQGVYLVEGKSLGKVYKGLAVIKKKKGVYQIQWKIGPETFIGVGLRRGSYMSATWAVVKDGKVSAGALLFRIQSGPKLVGEWTGLPSDGVVHQETLTFFKKLDE